MKEFIIFGVLAASYLIGSIPFGVIFSKLLRGKDPRLLGSKNIGFTNVLREVGMAPAILTLCGDVGKGALAAFLGTSLVHAGIGDLSGLAVILGHCYPVYLKFCGGKAVATSFGVLAVLYPVVGLITFSIWALTVFFVRIASVGALVSFGALPLTMGWFHPVWNTFLFGLAIAVVVFIRHRENISRLIAKQEGRRL